MRPTRQAGFTLLEALVAFAVLALCLGVAMQIFGQGAHAAARGRDYGLAVWIAESRLAQATAHSDVVSRGREGAYTWEVRIAPYVETAPAPQDTPLPLEQVRVRVQWGDERQRSLEVQGLRWAARE